MAQVGFAIGLPFGGRLVHPKWAVSLKTMDFPVNTTQSIIMIEGKEVTEARNMIAKAAIESKCKYQWFLDDDVISPRYAVQYLGYLLDQNEDEGVMVSTGIYCTKTVPPAPVIYRRESSGAFWDWSLNEVFDIDECGAGCMLINMKVFDHLEYPYFRDTTEYKNGEDGPVMHATSEDIYFCRSVKEKGFRIQAHGTVLCAHYDNKSNSFFTLPEDSKPVKLARKKEEAEAKLGILKDI